jgi:hypothetical protein
MGGNLASVGEFQDVLAGAAEKLCRGCGIDKIFVLKTRARSCAGIKPRRYVLAERLGLVFRRQHERTFCSIPDL